MLFKDLSLVFWLLKFFEHTLYVKGDRIYIKSVAIRNFSTNITITTKASALYSTVYWACVWNAYAEASGYAVINKSLFETRIPLSAIVLVGWA
jgi:hypothetical protein